MSTIDILKEDQAMTRSIAIKACCRNARFGHSVRAAAFAADDMKKDTMTKDSMSKDKMDKDKMDKDSMSKDGMKKNSMKKDDMKNKTHSLVPGSPQRTWHIEC